MTSDDKHKPEKAVASDPIETDQLLVSPERIDATVDEVLDKLFSTTPEQVEKWENEKKNQSTSYEESQQEV